MKREQLKRELRDERCETCSFFSYTEDDMPSCLIKPIETKRNWCKNYLSEEEYERRRVEARALEEFT